VIARSLFLCGAAQRCAGDHSHGAHKINAFWARLRCLCCGAPAAQRAEDAAVEAREALGKLRREVSDVAPEEDAVIATALGAQPAEAGAPPVALATLDAALAGPIQPALEHDGSPRDRATGDGAAAPASGDGAAAAAAAAATAAAAAADEVVAATAIVRHAAGRRSSRSAARAVVAEIRDLAERSSAILTRLELCYGENREVGSFVLGLLLPGL